MKKKSYMQHHRFLYIAAVMVLLALAALPGKAMAQGTDVLVTGSWVTDQLTVSSNITHIGGAISPNENNGTIYIATGGTGNATIIGNNSDATSAVTIQGGTNTITGSNSITGGTSINTSGSAYTYVGTNGNTTYLNSSANYIGVAATSGFTAGNTTNVIGNVNGGSSYNATNTIGLNYSSGGYTTNSMGSNAAAGYTTNTIGQNTSTGNTGTYIGANSGGTGSYTSNTIGQNTGTSTAVTYTDIGKNGSTSASAYTANTMGILAATAKGYTSNSIGPNASTTATAYTTNGIGVIAGAGYTTNNVGTWTGSGSGYSTNTIGNTNVNTTISNYASNNGASTLGGTVSVLANGINNMMTNASLNTGTSMIAGATQGTVGGVATAMIGANTAANPQYLINNQGQIIQTTSATANMSSTALVMTNGLGNTHGIVIQENQTTVTGGYHSTGLTLSDAGAFFRNSVGGAARVTGVADGQYYYDAVNYGQLRQVYGGVASAAALSQIPNPTGQNRFSIGMGYGNFMGANSFAFGAKAAVTKSIMLQFGVGFSQNNTQTWAAGVGYSF
jgi:hypothetical protein